MKKLWKIPNQTKCPECGAIFVTPQLFFIEKHRLFLLPTKNVGIPLIIDEETGIYSVDCPQCGETMTAPLDIWE